MHYSVYLPGGKQTRQSIDCRINSRLIVTDKKTKVQYLIDTGSDLCVLPPRFNRRGCKPTDYTLTAANGTAIRTYGTFTMHLDLALRREFKWNFVVAEVDKPIIGVDFMSH